MTLSRLGQSPADQLLLPKGLFCITPFIINLITCFKLKKKRKNERKQYWLFTSELVCTNNLFKCLSWRDSSDATSGPILFVALNTYFKDPMIVSPKHILWTRFPREARLLGITTFIHKTRAWTHCRSFLFPFFTWKYPPTPTPTFFFFFYFLYFFSLWA